MPNPPAQTPQNLREEIGKHDPFDLPEQEVYLNLARTWVTLSSQFARLFKEHGLSDAQYNALRIIAGSGKGGIRSEMIGRRMVTQDSDVTRLVDRLVNNKFVERDRLKEDRRCVLVRVTPDGRGVLKTLKKKVERLHRDQLGHMENQDLQNLNTLLFLARHRE